MTIPGASASEPRGGATTPRPGPPSAAAPQHDTNKPAAGHVASGGGADIRFVPGMTSQERIVWALIPHGKANAIKQRKLAAQCGIAVRTLQSVLKDLTESRGLPIASSCGKRAGVFVPGTTEEVDRYIKQLRSRALSCFARIEALRPAAARELVDEVQASLPLEAGELIQGQREEPDLPCTANLRPGERPSDDAPNGETCWCGNPLRGRQTVACCDEHRDVANGRRRLPL